MIDLSISTNVLAHGIHYAVLGVGVLGLLFLVGPQLVGRPARPAQDEHSERVRALQAQLAAGTLGSTTATPEVPAPGTAPVAVADRRSSLLLPVAIVSSAAAAGVHAAVCPEHFKEKLVFGLFFAASALAQIIWAVLVAVRPDRRLIAAAVVGNISVVALWAVTRTVGLGALLPKPEEVGPWDLTCGAWELVIAACCWRVLRSGDAVVLPRWPDWDRRARAFAIGSVLVLAVLELSGASA